MADDDAAPILQRVKIHRERLASAADGLEAAIARPAGDEARWRGAVQGALDELRAALDAHVEAVEAPDGLYADVATRSPRLLHAIDKLREDHGTMDEQTAALEAAVAADELSIEATRESAVLLLAEISRHRHRGADLLWDSYDIDLGGED